MILLTNCRSQSYSLLVAVLVLGVGDPSAALIGKRFGRRFKIYRQKSLAGIMSVALSFLR